MPLGGKSNIQYPGAADGGTIRCVTAKILITGHQGQLGRALGEACRERGIPADSRDLDTLDIRDRNAVRQWITAARPTVVVNCAAMTAVDRCETEIDAAVTHLLLDACRRQQQADVPRKLRTTDPPQLS